ncbi:hypothetical protein, partial [Bacillus toyonensis]|uniref:hypothetical protein n=1 Tax=Bacillus toyonensis TaxID=155322 RepID=UPI002DBF2A7F
KDVAKRKGWRFSVAKRKKIRPVPCGTFSSYIESEKGQAYKSRKKTVIPRVSRFFIVIEFDNFSYRIR